MDYYHDQLRELCTQYGEIGGVLFDGYRPRQQFEGDEIDYFAPHGEWDLAGAYDLIHELQPNALIANNTHVLPLQGEDYQVWELDLPGENTAGFNCTDVGDKPTACWWNLNAGWSYQPWNDKVKSAQDIFQTYQAVRKKEAVFLLNIGPSPLGEIPEKEQAVLRQVGQMIQKGSTGKAPAKAPDKAAETETKKTPEKPAEKPAAETPKAATTKTAEKAPEKVSAKTEETPIAKTPKKSPEEPAEASTEKTPKKGE